MEFDFLMETTGIFGLQQMCSDFWVMKVVLDQPDPNIQTNLCKSDTIAEIQRKMRELNISIEDNHFN
jgi:hypothetical protein